MSPALGPSGTVALLCLTIAVPCVSHAQDAGFPVRTELRVDLITGRQAAVQAGGGLQIPAGPYARFGIIGAVGARIVDRPPLYGDPGVEGESRIDGRLDLLGRFLLDPYRQSRYGVSVGAGISLRAETGDRVRPYLLAAADLEGPLLGGAWSPALQLGLGGGGRIGLLLRHGGARTR